jgi:hypothetical protein
MSPSEKGFWSTQLVVTSFSVGRSIDGSQEQIDSEGAVDCKNEDNKRNYSCLTQKERNINMGCQVFKSFDVHRSVHRNILLQ